MMAAADNRARVNESAAQGKGNDSKARDLTAMALAARTQDPQAVHEFLGAIAPSVRGVCRAVMGSNHGDLEDTIQDCLIEILRALTKYRVEGSVEHYVHRIVLRAAVAARTRGRERERRIRVMAEQEVHGPPLIGNDPFPDLLFLWGVIDQLSTVQSEAVLMRIILGYSVEEIAVATGVSVNTSKSRLRVAKDHLRHRLNEQPEWGGGDVKGKEQAQGHVSNVASDWDCDDEEGR